MNTRNIADHLRHRLTQPLPGMDAQFRMAPTDRMRPGAEWRKPPGAKESAVLILLYPDEGKLHLPLILRNTYNGAHSGQVSLPGGGIEPGDDSYTFTALREAKEEIGLNENEVEVLGWLSPLYIPVSNFYVQPVLGIYHEAPAFSPDPSEVAILLPTRLEDLKAPGVMSRVDITVRESLRMNVPAYLLHGQTIWGATAMILSELLEILDTDKKH